jgi:hypothetical protein
MFSAAGLLVSNLLSTHVINPNARLRERKFCIEYINTALTEKIIIKKSHVPIC